MLSKLNFGVNPIIVKELRSRMRGPRAFITLTGILLILALVSYALAQMAMATSRYSSAPVSPQIGQALFTGLVMLELMMVCGITPAVTAGAISGEQEKLTYEMLLATPLRPASILWGKLVSALSYVFLLVFAAVPMASLVFIFGGVAPRDMLKALVVVLVVMVMFGVLGLFMSALFGRTGRATVVSYLVVSVMLFGPTFFGLAYNIIRGAPPPRALLVLSPINALFSSLSSTASPDAPSSIFWMFSSFAWGGDGMFISQTGIPRPLYHYSLPLFGAITLVLYLLATRLVQPARRWKLRLKEVLLALALILGFAAVVGIAFGVSSSRYENTNLFLSPTPVPPFGAVGMANRVEAVQVIGPDSEPGSESWVYPLPGSDVGPDGTRIGPVQLSIEDQAAIYAAAIRYAYTVDHNFDEQPPIPRNVYLFFANPEDSSMPQVLPENVFNGIKDELEDLPANFVWLDDYSQAPIDPRSGVVDEAGMVITVSDIHVQGEGSMLVSTGLIFAKQSENMRLYRVDLVDGVWQVVGE